MTTGVAVLARDREDQPRARPATVQPVGAGAASLTGWKLFSSIRSKIATARSCSTSGVERPIDSSSSTSISLALVCGRRPACQPYRLSRIATERAMRVEPFGLGQRDRRRRQRRNCSGAELQDRGALHEIEHRQAGREARRARRRQHVVGAADIVADRLRRVAAEEDRAGIADPGQERLGVVDGELDMLGGDAVDQRHGLVERRRPG